MAMTANKVQLCSSPQNLGDKVPRVCLESRHTRGSPQRD
jgi:hypothetical protein